MPTTSVSSTLKELVRIDNWADMDSAFSAEKIQIVQGGHFDADTGPSFEITSVAAHGWFVEHARGVLARLLIALGTNR